MHVYVLYYPAVLDVNIVVVHFISLKTPNPHCHICQSSEEHIAALNTIARLRCDAAAAAAGKSVSKCQQEEFYS